MHNFLLHYIFFSGRISEKKGGISMKYVEEYIDEEGRKYNNVKEFSYSKKEILNEFDDLVLQTYKYTEEVFYDDEVDGIYLYRNKINPNYAYKIYKHFTYPTFISRLEDALLIEKCEEIKENVKLTNFPTGVITVDGKIIGTELPFYSNSLTAKKYFKKNNITNPYSIYIKMLKILRELYENNFIYLDVHGENFMIDVSTGTVNLIDFEYNHILFEDINDKYKVMILKEFREMMKSLNKSIREKNEKIDNMNVDTFENAEDDLSYFESNYKKRKIFFLKRR